MKAKVDADLCDGCGPCEEICPQVFKVVGTTARVQVKNVPLEAEASCRQAAVNCPTNAIAVEED